jgi:hypothetical protein
VVEQSPHDSWVKALRPVTAPGSGGVKDCEEQSRFSIGHCDVIEKRSLLLKHSGWDFKKVNKRLKVFR